MKRYWSMRAHLLALMLATILPFGGALTYLVVEEARQSARHARAQALGLARLVAGNVQQQISDTRQLLARLASQGGSRSMLPDRRAPIFDTFVDSHPQFLSFFKVNRTGAIVHSTTPAPAAAARAIAEAPWFQALLQTTNFLLTSVVRDPVNGQPVVLLVQPVQTARGLIGALCAGLGLLRLPDTLPPLSLPPQSVITVLDQEGRVVAHSVDPERWVGQTAARLARDREMVGADEGQFTAAGLDGGQRLYGFASVPAAGWHVLVGTAAEVAFAPVRASALRSGALAAGLMGLATLLALFLARRMSRPVRQLARALTQGGEQPVTAPLPVTGPRELAELAAAFNTTALARLQAEHRFRALAERSLTGVYMIQDARFAYVNPCMARLFGYATAEEIMGTKSVMELVVPEDRTMVAANIQRRLQGELDSLHYHFRGLRRDGTWIEVEVYGSRTELDGCPVLIGTLLDITARKQAEAERARLAEILEATSDFVGTATAAGRPIFLNRACRRALGLGEDEDLSAIHLGDYHPAWVTRVIFNEAIPTAEREGSWSGEVLWRARDGREIPTVMVLVVHPAPAGTVQYFSGVARDISPLKAAEQTLREVSARLLRVQEEEQQSIARELHDTTGQNLVALHMQLQLLQRLLAPTDPAAATALTEALRLANESTQQLRTLAYLLHPPVLDDLGLQGAVRDYALGFEQRSGVPVECDLDATLGPLPKELELALFRVVQESLLNLHRHSGSPSAAVRLWREGGELWLEVADAGCGIPAERLQAARPSANGLGVGIPGMRERIRAHGGRLEIRSSARGTTVQAIVPLLPRSPP